LLERRNQPCRPLDDHVGWATPHGEPSRFVPPVRTSGSYFLKIIQGSVRSSGIETLVPRSQGCAAVSDSSPNGTTGPVRHPPGPERCLPEILDFHFRPVGAGL
jgi:hypothetical protein